MQFNVILYDINSKRFHPYDVLPYFIEEYKRLKKKDRPVDREAFKQFILGRSMYRFWARCEYEIILSDWPPSGVSEKWDVHKQVEMNIEVITDLVMKSVQK